MREIRARLHLSDELEAWLKQQASEHIRDFNDEIVSILSEKMNLVKQKGEPTMATFEQTLEAFLASKDFEQGVIASTKASWGGSDYRVELLPTGTWQVLWKNQIGNRYESPGVIMPLPQLETDDMQQYVDDEAGTEEDFLSEAFILVADELKADMRNELNDRLAMMQE